METTNNHILAAQENAKGHRQGNRYLQPLNPLWAHRDANLGAEASTRIR
jgi:hypothetical protein